MSAPPDARRFNDKEVALVLRRAAQLQASDGEAGATLGELEQIAREAGIDPRFVRHAAQDLDLQRAAEPSRFTGGPTRLLFERTIAGALPSIAFETLAAELRTGLPAGQASLIGRTLTWTSFPVGGNRGGQGRTVNVIITATDAATTIRVEESLQLLSGSLYGGLMGGLGLGVGASLAPVGFVALHSILFGFGILAATVAAGYGLARSVFGAVSRRRARDLQLVFERLCARAAEAIATSAPSLPAASG